MHFSAHDLREEHHEQLVVAPHPGRRQRSSGESKAL